MGHVKVSCILMDEFAGGGRRGRFQGSTLANGLCAGKAQPGRETGRGCTARSMLPCAWPDGGAPSVSADTLLGDGESPRTMRTDLRSSGPRVKRTPRPRSSESGWKIRTTELLFWLRCGGGFSFSVRLRARACFGVCCRCVCVLSNNNIVGLLLRDPPVKGGLRCEAPAATASEIQAAPANLASKPSSSTDMASTMAAASNSLMSGNHPNYGQRELI